MKAETSDQEFPVPSDIHVDNRYSLNEFGFSPWVSKSPWRRKWQPTEVFLPEKSHEQRGLAGYSPWGCKESDTTEGLSLSLGLLTWDLYFFLT